MSFLINNQQKINDIVFDKRNKTYGAYVIRSAYGETLLKSLTFMILGFGTIIGIAYFLSNRVGNEDVKLIENEIVTVYNDPIADVPKDPEPPAPQPPQDNPGGNQSSMGTVINSTIAVETSTSTNVPTGPTNTLTTSGPPGTPTTTGEYTTVATTPTVDTPVLIYDTAPEFDGGLPALYAHLGKNLKYPDMAREIGKEGTVYVKFVVDQNGKVGSLTLLNNAGFGFDEEALRVVGLLPNFKKPGTVGGKAVKVYFQLPIKFKIR
ncbi:MAG: Gram-negative bacterial tonB protein [Bacteroidetes bacterium]|jgi:protein TonB|nr:Gram-negative bacterial tonB protein [Bacteroidota bacterium]